MKNLILLSSILFLFSTTLFAQSKSDKVFTKNEVKEVNVKEVTDVAIKYSYPGEETLYTLNKMLVDKIQFASGREEVFHEAPQYIKDLKDSKEVYLVTHPEEVLDLEQIGMLNSSLYKAGSLFNLNQSDDKQIEKLKLEAAMLGANVILVEESQQKINTTYFEYDYDINSSYNNSVVGSSFSSISPYFKGTAYRSHPLNTSELKDKISSKEFHLMTIKSLASGKAELQTMEVSKYTKAGRPIFESLQDLSQKGDRLFVSAKGISDEFDKLEVIDAGEDYVVLAGNNSNKISNFYLYTRSYVPPVISINVAMAGN